VLFCLPFSDLHRQKVNSEEYAYHGKKKLYSEEISLESKF
jgi:hypothetical protein